MAFVAGSLMKLVLWSLIILGMIAVYDALTRETPVIIELLSSPADASFGTFKQSLSEMAIDFKKPESCDEYSQRNRRCPELVGMTSAPSYSRALNVKRRILRVAASEGVRVNVDVEWEFIKHVRERFEAMFGFI